MKAYKIRSHLSSLFSSYKLPEVALPISKAMSDPIEAIAMNVNDNIEYLKEQDSHRYAVHMDYEPPSQDGCSVSVNLPLKDMSLWLYKHDVLITTEDRSAATGSDGANEEGAATSRQPFPHEQDDSSDDLMDEPRSEAADVQPRVSTTQDSESISALDTREISVLVRKH